MTDDNSRDTQPESYRCGSHTSRRAMLAVGGAGLLGTLAGCSSITGQSTNGPSSGSTGVFHDISFEGQQMVVSLREDHGVEKLNLIGPDGRKYSSASMSEGETTVDLQVLSIRPSDSFHYPIGTSTLIGVKSSSNEKTEIDLSPSLQVSSVSQHTGEAPQSYGNVEVDIHNAGTGPTWVFDLAYSDVPHSSAEQEGDGRGSPGVYLKEPDASKNAIIGPGETQTFVDSHPPFLFDESSACTGTTVNSKIIIKTGNGEDVISSLAGQYAGEAVQAQSASFNRDYACKNGNLTVNSDSTDG